MVRSPISRLFRDVMDAGFDKDNAAFDKCMNVMSSAVRFREYRLQRVEYSASTFISDTGGLDQWLVNEDVAVWLMRLCTRLPKKVSLGRRALDSADAFYDYVHLVAHFMSSRFPDDVDLADHVAEFEEWYTQGDGFSEEEEDEEEDGMNRLNASIMRLEI